MAAITKDVLEGKILEAFNTFSDVPGVNPQEARVKQAKMIAAAISDFVIGRTISGTSATGGAVTGQVENI